jgi:hypothetical protein
MLKLLARAAAQVDGLVYYIVTENIQHISIPTWILF